MSKPKAVHSNRDAAAAATVPEPELQSDAADDFSALIHGLTGALTPIEPRPAFADALRHDLLGRRGMWSRLRGMPPRVHIAAVLALLAGFGLLLTRRLFGSDEAENIVDEGVATAH